MCTGGVRWAASQGRRSPGAAGPGKGLSRGSQREEVHAGQRWSGRLTEGACSGQGGGGTLVKGWPGLLWFTRGVCPSSVAGGGLGGVALGTWP